MYKRGFPIGDIVDFGERLILTRDLDPVYVALANSGLPYAQLCRLLLAYFCFYHLGSAARISEEDGETYWELMLTAAKNNLRDPSEIDPDLPGGRWPRGTERRHFRGAACVRTVKTLHGDPEEPYPADHYVRCLHAASTGGVDLKVVMGWVQKVPMFGPWIAFKIADMVERILGGSIAFPTDLALIYREPRAALDMLNVSAEEASAALLAHFGRIDAPPRQDRKCNIQEVETICCKWKASTNRKYHIGKDIHEIREGLRGWGKTAAVLLSAMPPEVDEGLFGGSGSYNGRG